MTAKTAVLRDVSILQGPFDQPAGGVNFTVVAIYVDSNGVNVVSGADTLDLANAGVAIAGFIRDGKTYTPRAAMLLQPYRTGSTNVFGTVTVSTGTVSLTPTTSDFSTAAGITGSNPVDAPFGIAVACTVA
jgi:hypothetical protein